MGNWGYFTPMSGVITLLGTGRGPCSWWLQLFLTVCIYPKNGETMQFEYYFADGLKPPPKIRFEINMVEMKMGKSKINIGKSCKAIQVTLVLFNDPLGPDELFYVRSKGPTWEKVKANEEWTTNIPKFGIQIPYHQETNRSAKVSELRQEKVETVTTEKRSWEAPSLSRWFSFLAEGGYWNPLKCLGLKEIEIEPWILVTSFRLSESNLWWLIVLRVFFHFGRHNVFFSTPRLRSWLLVWWVWYTIMLYRYDVQIQTLHHAFCFYSKLTKGCVFFP